MPFRHVFARFVNFVVFGFVAFYVLSSLVCGEFFGDFSPLKIYDILTTKQNDVTINLIGFFSAKATRRAYEKIPKFTLR